MSHELTFQLAHQYNSLRQGIEIEVILKFGDEVITAEAKVDPGAEVCLFRREQGEMLGLEIENGHKILLDSLAGSLVAYGHTVTLHTLGFEFDSMIYFAADYGLRRNLLGREGWLQKVRLAIVDYETTLYLSPYHK